MHQNSTTPKSGHLSTNVSRLSPAVLVIFFAIASFTQQDRPTSKPPNLLLITVDTLRADHVGCYGYKQIRTPHIDALAAAGTRMEHAFTPVPITLPSHSVMMTGTYPMFSGMHDFSANRLSDKQATLASVLREHGYDTGAVIGSAVLDSRFGLNRGFDFYYDHFDFNRLLETNLDAMERPGNIVVDESLRWIGQSRSKPFFLWVHLYDAHYPYRPPAPYDTQYSSRPYDGEIAFDDQQIGRVIRVLKEKGLYPHTLIILAGDHGEGLGEHGEKTHGFFIYNSTLHVPWIVKPPLGWKLRSLVTEDVSLVDLMPTALDLLGIPVPSELQGHTLRPLLERGQTEPTDLYSETYLPRLHFNWSELRGLQSGGYHFIEAPEPELYQLKTDPGETHNLLSERKATGSELRARLDGLISRYSPDKELAQKTTLDPAMMERLKSLGYAAFSGGGQNVAISDSKLADPKSRIQVYEIFSEAMSDSQHERYAEAIDGLEKVLKSEPELVPAHFLMGLNYYRTQQFSDAVSEFEQVVRSSPDYALAFYYLGLSYGRSGKMEDAINAFQRTLQLDPSHFSAAYNLGSVLLKLGRVEEALTSFRRSVEIAPDYAVGFRAIGEVLLYRKDVDGALDAFRKAATLGPDDPACHAALAKGLEAKGLENEARAEMDKARALAAKRKASSGEPQP